MTTPIDREDRDDLLKRFKEVENEIRELLIDFKQWEIDNDIKNLLPEQLVEWYLEDSLKST